MASKTTSTGVDFSEMDLSDLALSLREGVEVQDRRYRLRTYPKCFVGEEACAWMVSSGLAADAEQAVVMGNVLLEAGVFHHVLKDHAFKNEYLFYRFAADEDHGRTSRKEDGTTVSWFDFVQTGWDLARVSDASLQAKLPSDDRELARMGQASSVGVEPLDVHNAALLDAVHPREWDNPESKGRYNMVVIGAGTGGLVTAAAAAGLGARVAMIEEHLMGGDCLNVGCVPSKALLSSAKAVAQIRDAGRLGVRINGQDPGVVADAIQVDFGAVMERLRAKRAGIAPHDSAQRFAEDLGIDVFIGRGEFTGPDTVKVGETTLTFSRACVATGGRPAIPGIPGLADAPYLTNLSVFNLTELPPRLGVIGGGAVGCELAQAFQRFGSQVTLFNRGEGVLTREDPDAAKVVQEAMARDGVSFVFGVELTEVRHRPAEAGEAFPTLEVDLADGRTLEFDALLVATGRKPNVNGLGLEAAGVAYDPGRGIEVDDRLQTTNSRVFAVGDVATRYKFTHVADFMARLVVRNALFFGRDRFSNLLISWCTYTDPEIAHVGLYASDLEERGVAYDTYTRPFAEVDRAIVEGSTEGFVRIHVEQGSDAILGATVVGEHAGDMISEITLAMQSGTGLGKLASVIHPYPTRAEAIRQVGDMYNRTRLTQTVKNLFRRLMDLRR